MSTDTDSTLVCQNTEFQHSQFVIIGEVLQLSDHFCVPSLDLTCPCLCGPWDTGV